MDSKHPFETECVTLRRSDVSHEEGVTAEKSHMN